MIQHLKRTSLIVLGIFVGVSMLGAAAPAYRAQGSVVLYDGTGAANTLFNTGAISTQGYSQLLVEIYPAGGAVAASKFLAVLDGETAAAGAIQTFALPADTNNKIAAFGAGAPTGASNRYIGGIPGALPPTITFSLDALGAGVTGRVRVIASR